MASINYSSEFTQSYKRHNKARSYASSPRSSSSWRTIPRNHHATSARRSSRSPNGSICSPTRFRFPYSRGLAGSELENNEPQIPTPCGLGPRTRAGIDPDVAEAVQHSLATDLSHTVVRLHESIQQSRVEVEYSRQTIRQCLAAVHHAKRQIRRDTEELYRARREHRDILGQQLERMVMAYDHLGPRGEYGRSPQVGSWTDRLMGKVTSDYNGAGSLQSNSSQYSKPPTLSWNMLNPAWRAPAHTVTALVRQVGSMWQTLLELKSKHWQLAKKLRDDNSRQQSRNIEEEMAALRKKFFEKFDQLDQVEDQKRTARYSLIGIDSEGWPVDVDATQYERAGGKGKMRAGQPALAPGSSPETHSGASPPTDSMQPMAESVEEGDDEGMTSAGRSKNIIEV